MAVYANYKLEMQGTAEGSLSLDYVTHTAVNEQERGGADWWNNDTRIFFSRSSTSGGASPTGNFQRPASFAFDGSTLSDLVENNSGISGVFAIHPTEDLIALTSNLTAGTVEVRPINADATIGSAVASTSISGGSISDITWLIIGLDTYLVIAASDVVVIPFTGVAFGTQINTGGTVSGCVAADPSPDGSKIYYCTSGAIGRWDFDGSSLTNHTTVSSPPSTLAGLRVHPTGDWVLVSIGQQPFVRVYPADLSGSGTAPTTSSGTGTCEAAFSNGGRFVILAGDDMDGGHDVYGYPFDPADGSFGSRVDPGPTAPWTPGAVTGRLKLSSDGAYMAWATAEEQLVVYSTGLSSAAFDDIIDDVFEPGDRRFITTARGRTAGRSLAMPETGFMSFIVDDKSGNYEYDKDLTGRDVKLTATYDSTDYPLWYGNVDEIGYESLTTIRPVATFRCLGRLGLLDRELLSELYIDLRVDEAIGHILDGVSWPSGARSLDKSDTRVRFFWASGERALDLVQSLVAVEGTGASFSVDGSGNFVFRKGTARWTATRSLNSQATISNSPTSDPLMRAADLTPMRRDVVNKATMTFNIRGINDAVDAIWQQDSTLFVPANSSRTIYARASDPSLDVVEPVAGTDYTVSSGSISSVTIDRTSGQVFGITFSAGGQGAQVTDMQLRGRRAPLVASQDAISEVDAAASIAQYGERTWQPPATPWPEVLWWRAQDLVDSVVSRYKTPRPTLRLSFLANMSDTAMLAALGLRELDRITVNYTDIRVSGDYWVEHISHRITTMLTHEVTLECEQVVQTDPTITEAQDSQAGNTPETSTALTVMVAI